MDDQPFNSQIEAFDESHQGLMYLSTDLEAIGFKRISDIAWTFGPKFNHIYPIIYTEEWITIHGTKTKSRNVYVLGQLLKEFPTLEQLTPMVHYVLEKLI